MPVKILYIALRIRVHTLVHELCYYAAFNFERPRSQIHKLVQPPVKVILVIGKVCKAGQVQRNGPYGSAVFSAAEEAAGAPA